MEIRNKKKPFNSFNFSRIQWFVHIVSWIPLLVIIIDGFTNNLTFNPIQEISQRTGRIAAFWLTFSLSCTPLNSCIGLSALNPLRRPLGLYAALYAGLHFLIFVILDLNLNFQQLFKTGVEKPFIILGSIALSILLMLTITSTSEWIKHLGKKWNQLHRLVYLAGFLIMVHYLWAVKTPQGLPIILSSIMAILLILRIPLIRKWCKRHQPPWIKPFNRFLAGGKRMTPKISVSTNSKA